MYLRINIHFLSVFGMFEYFNDYMGKNNNLEITLPVYEDRCIDHFYMNAVNKLW